MHSRIRLTALAGAASAVAIAVGACGSSSSTSTSAAASGSSAGGSSSASASSTASGPKVDLAGVCPATVVVQTDWNPEADHGHLYQMLGPNPSVNTSQKSVTSDLYANGQPTGVKLEIRAGGPAIGYSTVSAEMYEDKSITLGYVNTDESIEFSGKLPTTAVFAENNVSPQIVMWDPKTYPGVTTIKQLGQALPKNKGVVYYFAGAAYMDYLTGAGYLPDVRDRRQLQRHAGPVRRGPGQGRTAGLRHRRALHLRPRGAGLGQAGQVPADLGDGLAAVPGADVGPDRRPGEADAVPEEARAGHAAGRRRLPEEPDADQQPDRHPGQGLQQRLDL